MRRVLPFLLPLVLITGCDGGGLPPGPPGPVGATAELRAGFPLRGLADTIVIDVIDRLPLRTADLVGPGGVMPAGNIDVTASPRIATGQRVAGNPWQSAMFGSGSAGALTGALAMPEGQAGAALSGQQQLLATVSTAEITLPDPVAYRRDWARYRIRLSFGTPPGDVETREIAAPAPPPPGRVTAP